jgi:hypothetical protein
MNGKEKQDLELVLHRLNRADGDRKELHTDIKFIKDNLFNPKEGIWAEVKDNTRFRENTSKWRGVIGAGFIGLFFKQIYDLFT